MAVFAGAASGRAQGVAFTAGPERVVQGNPATFSVNVSPAGARCSLSVRYKSGAKQKGLRTVAAGGGIATWTWVVPKHVQPGVTHITASCSGAGRATRTMTVIGQVLPPKIDVVQSGYSIRPFPYGGTGVSWGAILANRSKMQDALQVEVLCNMVMADNRLIGTATATISDIGADSKIPIGGELTFPAGAPVDHLEITVRIDKAGPVTRWKPGVSFLRVEPGVFEPQWTGEIDGEVQNDNPTKTIQFVELYGVVFDAAGNILGGGKGFGFATLPPAARMVLRITDGMRPIPFAKAASALVVAVPTYKTF
ncbi:MAG: hypothetical protein ACJ74M_00750 [Gaiellaceae bacterium]